MSAWTTLGNVPDATIRLQAATGSGTPQFTFGCGSHDGTASCELGAMDAKSAPRQLQAQLTVPVTAPAVASASLTVIGSAAKLPHDPKASVAVTITEPTNTAIGTSPLPVGSLPNIPAAAADPSLSPGGSAATLFPRLDPSPSPSPSSGSASVSPSAAARTRALANTRALPQGAPVVGAQLLGLAALGLAFVLAVTRLSIRRRPAPGKAGASAGGKAGSGAGAKAGAAVGAVATEAPAEGETAETPEAKDSAAQAGDEPARAAETGDSAAAVEDEPAKTPETTAGVPADNAE